LFGIFSFFGDCGKQLLKVFKVLQLEEVKNKNNICKSHSIRSVTYQCLWRRLYTSQNNTRTQAIIMSHTVRSHFSYGKKKSKCLSQEKMQLSTVTYS